MELTIDEAIIQSRIQLTIWEEGCASKLDNSPKAVETLIEIAKKYQKIEQILKSLDDGEINYPQMTYYLREVLEDGNDK